MRTIHILCCTALASTVACVDLTLYKAENCAETQGQDETCINASSTECCTADELLPDIEYFHSAEIENGGAKDVVVAYSTLRGDLCGAAAGTSKTCFNYEDVQILTGAKWRTTTTTATGVSATALKMDKAANDDELLAPCLKKTPTTHIRGTFNGKIYFVKKSDFDKEFFKTLKTEEERFQYYAERVDIIKDKVSRVEKAEEAKSEK